MEVRSGVREWRKALATVVVAQKQVLLPPLATCLTPSCRNGVEVVIGCLYLESRGLTVRVNTQAALGILF